MRESCSERPRQTGLRAHCMPPRLLSRKQLRRSRPLTHSRASASKSPSRITPSRSTPTENAQSKNASSFRSRRRPFASLMAGGGGVRTPIARRPPVTSFFAPLMEEARGAPCRAARKLRWEGQPIVRSTEVGRSAPSKAVRRPLSLRPRFVSCTEGVGGAPLRAVPR